MYSVIVLIALCSCFNKYFINCDDFYPLDNSRNCGLGQQNMKEIYKYHRFYPMLKIYNLKPDGYNAKISFLVDPEIGSETHILLSESNELHDKNQCYEFVFGGRNIFAGVRRKNSIHEMCHFVKDALALYKIRDANTTEIETSVSVDGMVQLTFLISKFPIFLKDDGEAFKVNYIYINTNNTRLSHISLEDGEWLNRISNSKDENENSERETETTDKELFVNSVSSSKNQNIPLIVNMLSVSACLIIKTIRKSTL